MFVKRFIERASEVNFREGTSRLVLYLLTWPIRRLNILFLSVIGCDISKRHPEFKNFIKNQRVLILGSGPSANDIKSIPKDVKIFTCNASPKVLIDKKIRHEIGIYLCSKGNLWRIREKTKEYSKFMKVHFFLTDDVKYLKKRGIFNGKVKHMIEDSCTNNYYLRKLMAPQKIIRTPKHSSNHTSSGFRLLQYALYFGAKEIYLAGLDGGFGGYAWGEKTIDEDHRIIDNDFIRIISRKYNNIYSTSIKSPIVKFIKYKKLK
jgi:hypothetical protein